MRRLINERYAVKVADSLNVGKDASADHQREHVNGHEKCCANGKCDQHSDRDLCVVVQLNFHHCHLKARVESWAGHELNAIQPGSSLQSAAIRKERIFIVWPPNSLLTQQTRLFTATEFDSVSRFFSLCGSWHASETISTVNLKALATRQCFSSRKFSKDFSITRETFSFIFSFSRPGSWWS